MKYGDRLSSPLNHLPVIIWAGAGSVLRRLRSAKVFGKARGRADESPGDNRGGKQAAKSSMNDEVSKVLSCLSEKGRSGFVFGKNVSSADVLKKPIGPIFNVQFSNIVKSNPFGKSSNGRGFGKSESSSLWNSGVRNKFGSSMLSNQFSANVDRFAEKL
nr:hypothetical protein [Tanacetum cinerariifolium]